MLTDAERERYGRQLGIDGFGEKAQEKLSRSVALIAGAGGLGCAASLYLAAAGIGRVRIADHGEVELSNLNRQIAFTEGDIGRPKVEAMAERIAGLNSGVAVEPLRLSLTVENLSSLAKGCHVIVDALDNLPTRYALNKTALMLGIPIIHGAVLGFYGQMMTIVPGRTPCLMCLYRNKTAPHAVPVMGATPGVIGALQAAEAVKVITGLGRQMWGRLLMFDGLSMSFTEVEIPRDPDCPHCGQTVAAT
jgi:molybdopterin/thiamine biosynthesis adenylyltransferase